MNEVCIDSIVYNEHKVYYAVKSYEGNTLRIEQLKKQPDSNCEAVSIRQLQADNNKLNIITVSASDKDCIQGIPGQVLQKQLLQLKWCYKVHYP